MSVIGTATKTDLNRAIAACLQSFRRVAAQLDVEHLGETDFGRVKTTWDEYYFGQFAEYDRLLRMYVKGGGNDYQGLVTLSINQNNLHRLIEVLWHEIGNGPLGSTKAQARIVDLFIICDQLTVALQEACG
jgi:hypothetical protein